MAKKQDFRICQGFYTDPETQEETRCIVSKFCRRFEGNYTQIELLELLGYKSNPETIPLHQPTSAPKIDGCNHYIGIDSSVYIKSYEKRLRHK